LVWLYSYRFKSNVEYEPAMKYFLLLMMLVTGSLGIVLTGDIFNLFVFIEITGISAYALTAFYTGRDSAEASFKYVMMGSIASSLLLLAIMIIYSQLGTLNMADIASKIHLMNPVLKSIAFILFIVALGIEAEVFPLNGWAPDAYSEAPGPVGAAFAGIVVKAMIYAVIRFTYTIFDLSGAYDLLIIIGLVTLVFAEVSAIRQDKLKRMLAYSSIGQMGLVMVAFGLGTKEGVFAALFIMLNHAIIKPMLFFSGSYLVYHSKKKYISDIDGMGKLAPFTSIVFALGAFAIVGLPPFAGFWGKLSFLMAAADSNMILIIVLILAVSVVELVYYMRVVNRIFFFKRTVGLLARRPTINAYVVMAVLALMVLVIGFYPDSVSGYIQAASDTLYDKAQYIHNVLTASIQ